MFVSGYPALSSSEPSWHRRHLCSRNVARPASWTKPLETWTATESCVHVTAQKCTNITLDWTFLFLFFYLVSCKLADGSDPPPSPPAFVSSPCPSSSFWESVWFPSKKKGNKKNIRRWCSCTLHWQNESYPLDWIPLSLTAIINSFKEEAGMIRFLHPAPFQTHDWNE